MKIYTKTGDQGETGLLGGLRISKASPRIQAIGDVDELNCSLGIVRAHNQDPALDHILRLIQNELFDLGAGLAVGSNEESGSTVNRIEPEQVERLERTIDELSESMEPIRQFILPGGTTTSAFAHLARAIVRRAERSLVSLDHAEPSEFIRLAAIYLNRLSDLLFVLARQLNQAEGEPDVFWEQQPR